MAAPLIVAAACAGAALVPVMGIEYAPLFVAAAGGLAATQRLPVKFDKLKGMAMAAIGRQKVERRQGGRRDEDQEPLARIKALEESDRKKGKMLNSVVKELKRHVTGCESSSIKNEADNAKIIKTQADQGKVLADQSQVLTRLDEVLPWIESQFKASKWWRDLGHAASQFFWGMIRKNWDSLSGKLIFIGIGAYLVARGMAWGDVVKWIVAL